jgi:hypothetical protein
LKTIADYGVGADAIVSIVEASDAIATAARFIDRIAAILA